MLRVLALSAFALLAPAALAQGLGRGTADAPVTEWPVAAPDSLGLDLDALEAHRALCESSEATACLVAWRGHVVQEWYAPDYQGTPEAMQMWIDTRSAVKSVAAVLAGMLIADGRIPSVDAPVATLLPEWTAGADGGVTLRHLLSMTSGVARNPAGVQGPGVVAARDTRSFVLQLGLDAAPGERWAYSNEGAQLLSPLLERAAGRPLAAFARERLFDPLGMRTSYLMVDEYYSTVTIGGMQTRLREFARIGQLVANGGTWNGERLLPAEWIDAMLTPGPRNPYYGYLWWVDPELGMASAAGTFDQVLYVFRDLDLVVVRLQRDPKSGRNGHYWNRETPRLLRRIVEKG